MAADAARPVDAVQDSEVEPPPCAAVQNAGVFHVDAEEVVEVKFERPPPVEYVGPPEFLLGVRRGILRALLHRWVVPVT